MKLSERQHNQGWKSWEDNPFGLRGAIKKDTGGGGKCQFSSVAESLYPIDVGTNDVRMAVGRQVLKMSDEDFEFLLTHYRIEKSRGEFHGTWNPDQVKTKLEFARLVTAPNRTRNDNLFWGDNQTLALIANAYHLRIYILEQIWDSQARKFTPHLIVCESSIPPEFAIMLWYANGHYQSVGVQYPRGKKTLFRMTKIPQEIVNWKQK